MFPAWPGPAARSVPSPAGALPGLTVLPAVFQTPDLVAMRKLQAPGETGVPVSRNGFLSGLKAQNGHIPPKLPLGSPSPRLSKAPTPLPTILDEPGKKVKKSAPLQHLSQPLKTSPGSHGASSRGDSHRPGSWDGRGAGLSTSPKLVPAATANGHGPAGIAPDRAASSSSSPEHSGSSDPAQGPPTPRSGASRFCDSQGRTPTAGPPRALLNGEASTVVKPRAPALSSMATEPANAMSPPPAKKLALSAKKVGVRVSWLGVSGGFGWGSETPGPPGHCRSEGLSRNWGSENPDFPLSLHVLTETWGDAGLSLRGGTRIQREDGVLGSWCSEHGVAAGHGRWSLWVQRRAPWWNGPAWAFVEISFLFPFCF